MILPDFINCCDIYNQLNVNIIYLLDFGFSQTMTFNRNNRWYASIPKGWQTSRVFNGIFLTNHLPKAFVVCHFQRKFFFLIDKTVSTFVEQIRSQTCILFFPWCWKRVNTFYLSNTFWQFTVVKSRSAVIWNSVKEYLGRRTSKSSQEPVQNIGKD